MPNFPPNAMRYQYLETLIRRIEQQGKTYVLCDRNDEGFTGILDKMRVPKNYRVSVRGILAVNDEQANTEAIYLSDSRYPLALDARYIPLARYIPDWWYTKKLPIYWQPTNEWYLNRPANYESPFTK